MFNPALIIQPFLSYRWQWGPSTPTESFNTPSIFFGCLEVLAQNEGNKVKSEEVYQGLLKVENDLKINSPKLARSKERNLFRNSGQYWKNLGLIEATSPEIKLTKLGRAYINGDITKSEFSCQIIKSLSFPNRNSDHPNIQKKWDEHSICIKPLEYLLEIILILFNTSKDEGYLTGRELTKIVIPLSGNKFTPQDTSKIIFDYRKNNSILNGAWDAQIGSNDNRIAREFLLFLHHYGFLEVRDSRNNKKTNQNQEFFLIDCKANVVSTLLDVDHELISKNNDEVTSSIIIDKKISIAEVLRERKTVEILSRPNQAKFRKDVLDAGAGICLLSGVTTPDVIQACHIVQVKDNGNDDVSNGLLLRVDLHTLYDNGHIRILDNGVVKLSTYLKEDPFYGKTIPSKVEIPKYVNLDALRLRNAYNIY
ncbi:hypothetical protein CJF25_16125 [Photobacterium phosphoreum]|uniref:HNH endonuclease n=1 Tax=Photobacterium phosphoreum TaxID=659 RepID=UPI001E2B4B6B|nr:HNH endonuclease signature motif containing protein [Photobacterium phosphoreum]MCD9464493.1 hypothetical protein [Photobacterium phosphoreum]